MCKTLAPPAGKAGYVPVANVVGKPCTGPSQVVKITTLALGLAAETQPVSRGYFDGCFRRVSGRIPELSLLDKTRIQAQVLVPVMRALRAELGQDKADAIVRRALRDWSKQLFASIGDDIEGSPRRKWAAMHQALAEVTEREVTFDMLRQDEEALEFNITSCRFAEFFRALGEPELGALLVCETDVDIAAAGEGRVEFSRAQTIMQGAPCCTFRYKFT